MPEYNYIGRDRSQNQIKGSSEAANSSAMAELLLNRGITPISIELATTTVEETSAKDIDIKELLGMDKVSSDDLIIFCRQMYALVKSGVPILRAIKGMVDASTSKKLKSVLSDISNQLEGGFPLSTALHQHPEVFSSLFVSIIHVGENTGKLDEGFLKLASYFEREKETRKRIQSALRYPSFVLAAILGALVILNIFVIPTFNDMFSRLGADLPLATKMLIASSDFFVNYWPHMLIASIVFIYGLKQYLTTEKGKYFWDKKKINLPIVGSIIERSILARFSYSFSIILKSGVPMTTGLLLVSEAVDNTYMQKKIITIRSSIESGESLLRAAYASKLFTPLVLQMIAVGEETGRVDDLLEEVGQYYEREVDYELSTLTARIEPIMIAIVAAMVLVLALGIFTPMWDMMNAYQ